MTFSSIGELVLGALSATWLELLWVFGPAAACAVVLHQLERITATLVTATFGWRGVLVTAWLGTPVHELSHVITCVVFAHEIEEVQLFAPDPETGTLGLVRHRASAGNLWAELGRFFIGVAPLLGGAAALYVVARVLLPGDALLHLAAMDLGGHAQHGSASSSAWVGFSRAWGAAVSLWARASATDPRFWVFLYLTTCIGSHLAPSATDLRGALRGGLALLAVLFVANLVAAPFGGIDANAIARVAQHTTPIVALLVLAVFLSAMVLVLVLTLTLAAERLRGAQGGQLRRFVRDHAGRLALAGAACVAFAVAAGALDLTALQP